MREDTEAAVETAKGVLQDIVVVVSLVRTLTETFGSASDLYRKLKRKRSDSHSSDDEKGNREKTHHRPVRKRRDSESDCDRERGRGRHISWSLGLKKDEDSDSDEEVISTSSSLVLAEYDRGYRKVGESFARGDLVTQNQLQAQVIRLQSTLLSIHQDYMMSSYLSPSSSHSHVLRLIQTTRSARTASIQALHMQCQRMLESQGPNMPPDTHHRVPGAFPSPPEHRPRHDSITRRPTSKDRHGSSRHNSPAKEPEEVHILPYPKHQPQSNAPQPPYNNNNNNNKLFCVYARDLQNHPRLPLTDNYKVGGDGMCPYCHAHTRVRPGKAWEIIADSCHKEDYKGYRFLVKNRFVIKCHREDGGGFACVLCARFKESDTVCKRVEALMEHLWKDHTREELEKDDDVYEIDE
ncbi:hypothetical protein ACEQ8H_002606 [Pleosporales sp. CAS-2024a]